MHIIGTLNRSIYSCVTEDICTDEVIITDKQIEHIKERHSGDYERFHSYFADIIANPDYILEANKPNTAFVLKEIVVENEKVQCILRLKTSSDPDDYKNSVITFLRIDQKKWAKYLRNKKILYNRMQK
ncbi:MAG: PBECR2 nuclease fold domain-containing protein [Peptococcaceae bacterium]|jgi:predicted dinucleotide-utilizing enzyme